MRDSNQIISAVRKVGWNVDMVGQSASYDEAVAELPGGASEGFYSMTPALFAYPDDPRPDVQEFAKKYKAKWARSRTSRHNLATPAGRWWCSACRTPAAT